MYGRLKPYLYLQWLYVVSCQYKYYLRFLRHCAFHKLEGCIVLNEHNTVFAQSSPLGPRVLYANGISITSELLQGSPDQTDRQTTDHTTRSFTICGIYLRIVKEKTGKEESVYSTIYILCISQSAQVWITVLAANTPCLPLLRKRSPASPTKMFYYLSFALASAHVKQAVLLIAFDQA